MKFLRNVLATVVGIFLFFLVSFLFLLILISAASEERLVKIEDNSILHLKLDKAILERERPDAFSGLGLVPGFSEGGIGLIQLKDAIRHAAEDDKIAGILLEAPFIMAGFAAVDDIRTELDNFRGSGKFLFAYSELYTEGGYYLASVADSVFLNPDQSVFEFDGINLERTFLKRMFDKLGIEAYVFKTGDFKDAFEPFTEEKMNPRAKEHLNQLINALYGNILKNVARSRNMEVDEVARISKGALAIGAEDALDLGLVDVLAYRDEVYDILRQKTGLEGDAKLKTVSYGGYRKSYKDKPTSKNRIAVIMADGEIIGGKGEIGMVGSERFAEEISKARKDSKIKAIVLRVNSPGGGALASDVIWREIELAAAEKPVIASMGDVAASGGYYLAMACDTIVVQPNTITGSIGVTAFMFNVEKLMSDKIGLTTDQVKTGDHSDLYSMSRPKTPQQIQMLQMRTNEAYASFLEKAAKGRNMGVEQLEPLAGGRVWTGEQALQLGLADLFGDLDRAIEIAAEKAGISGDFRLRYYPVQKDPIEELISRLSGDMETRIARNRLGIFYDAFDKFRVIERYQGIQARLPFDLQYVF